MKWRTPVGPLVHEHRLIEAMIGLMRVQVGSIAAGGPPDPVFVDTATDFIRTYADRCHHGKEEDILFRALATKDLTPDVRREMEGLIEDHARARALTGRLADANARYVGGDTSAVKDMASSMDALVTLYPAHIEKEDHHFFRECLKYLPEAEQAAMLSEFETFDASLIHEKYHAIIERLTGSAG